MAIPQVAIVGRPNVGKSSLFNWLARRRIAIVDPTAGVTRDRLASLIRIGDRFFELFDTGGIGIEDVDNLTAEIEHQIDKAIAEAAVVLFVVDVRAGLTPLDEDVARRLRYVTSPVLCVANKADSPELEPQAAEFYKLGRGKLICVSAQQNRGRKELLDLIHERLPPPNDEQAPDLDSAIKLAIVGRRNTGKSTFINSLAEADRVIVSEVAGTTRDSVDVHFKSDGKVFIAIDTAGVRRKGSISSDVEFYSMARAERSIRRADVVLLFHDAREEVSKVDKQLAGYVLDQHKPAIFVINKWDLMAPLPTGKMAQYLRAVFPSLDYVPLAFITAKSGKNVQGVLNLAQSLHKQASARVGTGDLNRVVRHSLTQQPPPMRQNRRAKVYYATQVSTNPPTIVLFTNGPELFDNTYQRYLLNTFRDHLPFHDVAIKMYLRHKRREEELPEEAAPPAETPKPREKRRRAKAPDVSRLKFQTDVSEEELQRDKGRYDSELWKDLQARPEALAMNRLHNRRLALCGVLALALCPVLLAPVVGQPAFKTQSYNGKVVPLTGVLEKSGVRLDPDAAPHWLALVGDGKVLPLIKDDGARMFFKDARLLNRPMRLTGRLVAGTNLLQVVNVHSYKEGKLHEVYYWCDICSIRGFELHKCDCCGDPMVLREVPVK